VKNRDQIVAARVLDGGKGPHLGRLAVLDGGQVSQPAFTPDGVWVTYLRTDGDSFALYAVRATGGKPFQIDKFTGGVDSRWRPVWMP
jgi:hypothetical protein